MAKASMVFMVVCVSTCSGIRATTETSHYWFSADGLSRTVIETALRKNPASDRENIRVTDLGKTQSVSHHLVQVRVAEPLHIHRDHDLTIFVYRGQGIMRLGTNQFTAVAGDVIFVPKAVEHRFQNTGKSPAVAVVACTPALLERDFEIVPTK
jgi:mannose-6-phosphate isomerase-like protein (cupin superfamily)